MSWKMFDKFMAKKDPKTETEKRFADQEPGAIHREPDCHGHNRCTYPDPHHHGFGCDKTCIECWGMCHPDCPANETIGDKK